jgi:hypothetical protein
MRHFLDSNNVRAVQQHLKRVCPPGYLVSELADRTGQNLFLLMRDWYRQIPNPDYSDVGDLTADFIRTFAYSGGESIDLPLAMQFSDHYNSGGHCFSTVNTNPGCGRIGGCLPEPAAREVIEHNAKFGHYPQARFTAAGRQEPSVDRNPREYAPRLHQGRPNNVVSFGAPSAIPKDQLPHPVTRQIRPLQVHSASQVMAFSGNHSHDREGFAVPKYYKPTSRSENPNLGTLADMMRTERDWIYYTLEPELLQDIQYNLNRHYDSYKRCSGRRSDQRMVKVENEQLDDQPNRQSSRLPNARSVLHRANKKVSSEPLYYSSDPLSNGSAYCGLDEYSEFI